ncbi:D-glycero-beta-D-manno-heptose 1,7-bisphosphate 7-phosphatase [Aquincola sp. MAHUQ-54]|uniref:D,D-heptose 1,7-bisphosphate phosphatase n=1 Tax=Aquincola agrisoli TaxID=3119538 RepID=A0AAW9Q953_9BURK
MVILDRDGVINHDSEAYIRSPDEWEPIDGAIEAVASLSQGGIDVVVATNQAGVAKGIFNQATLDAIHCKLLNCVQARGGVIRRIYCCTHHPEAGCQCRKPQPGMLRAACGDFGVLPSETIFVGDSMRDLLAAEGAGCIPALVKTGNGVKTLATANIPAGTMVFDSLETFSGWYLSDFSAPRAR